MYAQTRLEPVIEEAVEHELKKSSKRTLPADCGDSIAKSKRGSVSVCSSPLPIFACRSLFCGFYVTFSHLSPFRYVSVLRGRIMHTSTQIQQPLRPLPPAHTPIALAPQYLTGDISFECFYVSLRHNYALFFCFDIVRF